MSLKFDKIKIDKKKFYKLKQPTGLNLVDTNKIVISDKFKHTDDGFKYFIGYQEGNMIGPFCLGYIKYFENGGKNMSFIIKDDSVLVKYNEIWKKIRKALSIQLHGMSVYDEKYTRAKVRGVIK